MGQIPWNFSKFLLNSEGRVLCYFDPRTEFKQITPVVFRVVNGEDMTGMEDPNTVVYEAEREERRSKREANFFRRKNYKPGFQRHKRYNKFNDKGDDKSEL